MGQGKDVVDKLLCNACCVDIIDETATIYLVIWEFVVYDLAQKGVFVTSKTANVIASSFNFILAISLLVISVAKMI